MGLDWNPGNKPKPGHEDEFTRLVRAISADNLDPRDEEPSQGARKSSFFSMLKRGPREPSQEQLVARFNEITIAAYETLNAPRVGRDPAADQWAREKHQSAASDKPLDEWLRELDGYYVVALVPTCDGLPVYTHGAMGYVELYSFRAEFLKDCEGIIGSELLDAAYTVKLPRTFLQYGDDLLTRAADFSRQRGIAVPDQAPDDPETVEGQLHIVAAAGRWCRFWAERGHMLDSYW